MEQIMKKCGNLHGAFGQVQLAGSSLYCILTVVPPFSAIIGLQGFFPLKGQAAVGVGSIEYPPAERKRLAAL
jgi:hypothetical protein